MSHIHNRFDHDAHARRARENAMREMWTALRERLARPRHTLSQG